MKKGGLFGNDTVNIAGHKVPYALLGALAAILGAVLIWKFNSSGVGAGSAPTTAASTDVYGGTQDAALANLSQQISDLGATTASGAVSASSASVAGGPPNSWTPAGMAGTAPAKKPAETEHQMEWLKAHPGYSLDYEIAHHL